MTGLFNILLSLALCALPLRAQAGALDDLLGRSDNGTAAAPLPVSSALPAPAADLPDETIAEERPAGPEVLPLYRPGAQAKAAFNFDPGGVIPENLRGEAYNHYKAYYGQFSNTRYVAVIDFSAHSSRARLYIADTERGTVKTYHVAHGSGSDADHDGYATVFSNKANSNSTSLGLYLTGELYSGNHGQSMRLHGLSATNSNAYERAIVVHSADYVADADVKQGRSWGCPAVSKASLPAVLAALKGGALIYAGLSR